jgi:hypothetical protein
VFDPSHDKRCDADALTHKTMRLMLQLANYRHMSPGDEVPRSISGYHKCIDHTVAGRSPVCLICDSCMMRIWEVSQHTFQIKYIS